MKGLRCVDPQKTTSWKRSLRKSFPRKNKRDVTILGGRGCNTLTIKMLSHDFVLKDY